ncbi:hypothetical protein [Streptomyces sp. NPDC015131]|uniref:hypothetical protein n=1 Tax=Streptomyces sp. NPDC015131 TaxID=3364941 RepID=UPI0037035BDD
MVAGESPDKSEQQKSPGETASDVRDPRLAVTGDTTSPDGDAEQRPAAAAGDGDRDGDARLRDAVAAWVTKTEDPHEGAPEDPEAEGPSEEAAPVEDAPAAGAGEPAKDAPTKEAPVVKAPAEDAPTKEAPVVKAPAGDAPTKEAPAPVVAPDADAPDADAPDTDTDATDTDAAETDAAATGTTDTGTTDTTDTAPAADAPAVDQPTAVFRAVQRKPVDQPTTTLKAVTAASSGKSPKPEAEPGPQPGSKPAPAPESDAERTSTFVPLRGDDVRPAARKPEPQAPTPPAARSGAAAPKAPQAAAPAAPATGTPAAATPASLTEPERTKQQPLPPRPPLDMLAELTNTPPPPETPVRTVVRRIKIWTPLVLLLVVVFAIVQFVRPLPAPTLALTAKPSYTFEGGKPSLPWPGEGQGYMSATGLGTIDSFGEQKAVPIGSVAKAMTAYVILKEHPLKKGSKGPMIEVDALAEKEGGYDAQNESTLNTVKAGDKISEYDALAAIMIPSANNIARLLARWDAGSEKAFVEKMNATAKELGMKNTTYTDPSGLNHTTVSSAEDQVKLGEKLVEIPALLEITAMPNWYDPSGKKWRNYNDLVPYNGALGIKTGSTTRAGGNLLFAAHKKVGDTDQLIVGAVLAQYKTPILGSAIAASKEAMLATQELLQSRTVVKKGDVVGHVDDGLGGTTPVVATKDVAVVGWSGLTVKLELGDAGKALPHSAPAGTKVGELTVGEGASQVRVPVALKTALAEPGLGDKLTRIG